MLPRLMTIALLVMSISPAVAGEEEDAAAFQEVQTKLKKSMPDGWELVVMYVTPFGSRDQKPYIVIRTKDKIPIERILPSSGGAPPSNPQKNPFLSAEIVEISLMSSPLIRPREWRRLWKQNRDFHKRRIEFGRKHFKGMRWFDPKGARLYQPKRLRPKTEEQKKRVKEYAFLLMRTPQRDLPTHFYKSLSFSRIGVPFTTFKDKRDERRYDQISSAIEKTLTKYKRPMK